MEETDGVVANDFLFFANVLQSLSSVGNVQRLESEFGATRGDGFDDSMTRNRQS